MTNDIFTWYWYFLLWNQIKTYTYRLGIPWYNIHISAIIYIVDIYYLTARFTRRLRCITTEKVIVIYIFLRVLRRFLIDFNAYIYIYNVYYIPGQRWICHRSHISREIWSFRYTGVHSSRSRYRREPRYNYECVLFLLPTSDFRHLITNGCSCTALFSFFLSAGRINVPIYYIHT